MGLLDPLRTLLDQQMAAAYLANVRMLLAVAIFLKGIAIWPVLLLIFDPQKYQMPYWDWLPGLHPTFICIFMSIWLLLALIFFLGAWTKLVGSLLTLSLGFVLLVDRQCYSNHLYLLVWLCLLVTLSQSNAVRSLDSSWYGEQDWVPAWPATLLQCQISIVYFFGAITKFTPGFLSGMVLARNLNLSWLGLSAAVIPVWCLQVAAVAALGLEVFLSFGLWLPRWRRLAAVFGILFHLNVWLWLAPAIAEELLAFGLAMLAVYPLFWAPRRAPALRVPGTERTDSLP